MFRAPTRRLSGTAAPGGTEQLSLHCRPDRLLEVLRRKLHVVRRDRAEADQRPLDDRHAGGHRPPGRPVQIALLRVARLNLAARGLLISNEYLLELIGHPVSVSRTGDVVGRTAADGGRLWSASEG